MTERISYQNLSSKLLKSINSVKPYLGQSGLDPKFRELLSYRVSQINGCAYCLDMHHKELIHLGEDELRLHSLPAWRECPFYTDKEKAALAFAEAVTNANKTDIDDHIFDRLKVFFSESEITYLTLTVTQTNTWNRINKVFRPVPGNYKVGQFG
ncbi:alkylhydroperoxidase AhpD family core domain-containing protein [Fodinibius roseus]|uniref:Alkylhydroperoxidase AhpD family core domain-containing protein n=1 Tax=Fodinibius roseus TaxID=1194090 RepID=A0A1M5ES13_9BACT|nr:carboxymuconolactone decarboxylase family protein [Fodinibius roseus]SHF81936.1 alkylhydroperoxidase AhpD family core domain-containing protein [Fodinibius roseus]